MFFFTEIKLNFFQIKTVANGEINSMTIASAIDHAFRFVSWCFDYMQSRIAVAVTKQQQQSMTDRQRQMDQVIFFLLFSNQKYKF